MWKRLGVRRSTYTGGCLHSEHFASPLRCIVLFCRRFVFRHIIRRAASREAAVATIQSYKNSYLLLGHFLFCILVLNNGGLLLKPKKSSELFLFLQYSTFFFFFFCASWAPRARRGLRSLHAKNKKFHTFKFTEACVREKRKRIDAAWSACTIFGWHILDYIL